MKAHLPGGLQIGHLRPTHRHLIVVGACWPETIDERSNGMRLRTMVIIASGVITAAGIGAGVAIATNDTDTPISDTSDRERAEQVVLDHVGEGRVTETEEGDEESYYEVEVTRDDGSQVDVQLDRDFKVVGQEEDDERSSREDSADGS